MRLDTVIRQRFSELATKADDIAKEKRIEYLRNTGKEIAYASHPKVVAWGTSVISLFQQVFGAEGVHCQHFKLAYNQFSGYYSSFETLLALFNAAREDYEGGYIFSIQGLTKAEVLSDAMEQAEHLLANGYKDPACVLIGVSLETAIKHLATKNGVATAKLDKMNADLAKVGVYNVAKQKQITAWADLRNKGAHGEWEAYSNADIQSMHTGVTQFIADFL
ncbi:hypothetical protein TMEC54S_01118 [Thauera mechernichensis]